jgi:hypothetical protein
MHYYTRGEFATAFLKAIDAPVTRRNRRALLAWMQAEGDAGRFNPLNTTHAAPGATDFNWVGVKNYVNFGQGVWATAETLHYGANRNLYGYRAIRSHLRNNDFAAETLGAVERSAWGTGGLALRVLQTVPILSNLYAHHRLAQ